MSIIRAFGSSSRGSDDVLAVVESPAQLLNVIEWAWSRRAAHAGARMAVDACTADRFAAGMTICVLAPTAALPRLQLTRMCELARDVGFSVSWLDVRGGPDARLRALPGLVKLTRRAGTLVIGDPFSGALQLLLATASPESIVVVDDGSATVEFAKLISSGADLLRWHTHGDASVLKRQLAGAASRRLTGRRGGFELFTAMPIETDGLPAFVRVTRNAFGWVRHAYGPPTLRSGADLIGTSLTESGVVSLPHYLRAVATLARRHRVDRYLAHRRESNEKLAQLAGLGLQIIRPELPLEIVLRRGPVGRTLISFPSTVVHTLPVVLAGSPVDLLTCDIDQQWFTDAHTERAGAAEFLSGMTATAREQHGLTTVAA